MDPRIGKALTGFVLLLSGPAFLHGETQATGKPMLTAGRLETPPVIDGRIQSNEWQDAACLTNFTVFGKEEYDSRQTRVYLGYDNNNLYISFHCDQPGSKPQASIAARDGPLWEDDAIEIFFQPSVQDTVYYQFIGNSSGYYWDSRGTDGKWNGSWQYSASTSDGFWEGEIRGAWAALGMSDPSDGSVAGLNVCRDIKTPTPGTSCWSTIHGLSFHDQHTFGRVMFSSSSPLVRFEPFTDTNNRRVGTNLELLNPTASSRTVTGQTVVSSHDEVLSREDLRETLAPHSRKTLQNLAARDYGSYLVSCEIRESSPGREQVLATTRFALSFSSGMQLNKKNNDILEAELDLRGVAERKGSRMEILVVQEGRELIGEIRILPATPDHVKSVIDISRLSPGHYDVRATLYGPTSKIVEFNGNFWKNP